MNHSKTEKQSDHDSKSHPRLAYLLRYYPRFSETFIVNEILALESHGSSPAILAMRKPDDGAFHESVTRVRAVAQYLPDPGPKLRAKARPRFWKLMKEAPRKLWQAVRCVWRFKALTWSNLQCALCLLHWAKKSDIEHVHVHFGREAAGVAMLAAMLGKVRYSMTLHAYDIFRDDVDSALLARKIELAQCVITVTQFNRTFLEERYPQARGKVIVQYNGVDLSRFTPPAEPREKGLVFSVGRLIEKKGFADLIRAAALLRDQGVAFRCVIAGDGEDADRLRELIASLNLSSHIELAGLMKQDDVRRMMQKASCFVLPCVQAKDGNMDALPTVLLESLACGCPSISTRVSGVPEIIDDGDSGLLVEPSDVTALAGAMRRVLTDDALASHLSQQGRRRAQDRFDGATNGASMLAILEAAARRKRLPMDSHASVAQEASKVARPTTIENPA